MLLPYRWKEIVDNIILPVANLPITFDFCFSIFNIVNIQSGIVLEITERYFVEFLCEE